MAIWDYTGWPGPRRHWVIHVTYRPENASELYPPHNAITTVQTWFSYVHTKKTIITFDADLHKPKINTSSKRSIIELGTIFIMLSVLMQFSMSNLCSSVDLMRKVNLHSNITPTLKKQPSLRCWKKKEYIFFRSFEVEWILDNSFLNRPHLARCSVDSISMRFIEVQANRSSRFRSVLCKFDSFYARSL